ncbi:MAG TPA: HIT family protein [Alphaproteobacteria bacterium]|nr:HIT family protein [Alphaproteobacteria bacterium]
MPTDPSCIFCKIVAGTIPCFKLYEDPKTLAFLDINPVNPGHALVIPKAHAANLLQSGDGDLAAVMSSVRRVSQAIDAELNPYGLNLLQANGPGAAQSVMHFHMHIIPRRKDDNLMMNWPLKPGDKEALAALTERLKRRLG